MFTANRTGFSNSNEQQDTFYTAKGGPKLKKKGSKSNILQDTERREVEDSFDPYTSIPDVNERVLMSQSSIKKVSLVSKSKRKNLMVNAEISSPVKTSNLPPIKPIFDVSDVLGFERNQIDMDEKERLAEIKLKAEAEIRGIEREKQRKKLIRDKAAARKKYEVDKAKKDKEDQERRERELKAARASQ